MHELIDPRGRVPDRTFGLAERTMSTSRPTIGFLINEVSRKTGPDFYAYTEVMEVALRKRRPDLDVLRDCKPVLSRPAGDDLLAHFRDCSGVVAGLAK